MKLSTLILIMTIVGLNSYSQEWIDIPLPHALANIDTWELQEDVSDDFNYLFPASNVKSNFGNDKWYNFYHNKWDGPGTTYWQYNHVKVDGDDLVIWAARNSNTTKMNRSGVNAGCVSSHGTIRYPVFIETRISVANIALASDVWLLSRDDTQEIDIIECYGGSDAGNEFFSQFIHLSHHSFIRNPFTDYQPKDRNSWWSKEKISSWGEYCWNKGKRKYIRVGVYWVGPNHFEYYIDGERVRVLYDKAYANKIGSAWYYSYPIDLTTGYHSVHNFKQEDTYSFETLKAASEESTISVIDPYNFQKGNGFTKELDVIINVESQDWHVVAGRTPSDEDLADSTKNTMKVDWIRAYKPVNYSKEVAGKEYVALKGVSIYPSQLTLAVGEIANVSKVINPSNATIQMVSLHSDDESIATISQQGVLRAISEGSTKIVLTEKGMNMSTSSAIRVLAVDNKEFNKSILIEAENFDSTTGKNDDSSFGGPGFGVNKTAEEITYVNKEDQVVYTIDVLKSGDYLIKYYISTPVEDSQIQLTCENTTIVHDVIPTGDWQKYQIQIPQETIYLKAGVQTILIEASSESMWQWNLDKITLTRVK